MVDDLVLFYLLDDDLDVADEIVVEVDLVEDDSKILDVLDAEDLYLMSPAN